MGEILVDSYNESNQDSYSSLYDAVHAGAGQSFTAVAGNLSKAKLYICKWGSPTGNIYSKLYAHTGTYGSTGKPTGSPLAVSDAYDVSTIPAWNNFTLIQFVFSGANQYLLVNGTHYVITTEYVSGSSSNAVRVGADSSSPTHDGNGSFLISGTWYDFGSYDYPFYVYALEVGGIVNTMMTQQIEG